MDKSTTRGLRDYLMTTGLFHRNYAVLPLAYVKSFSHTDEFDLVLCGTNNIVYEPYNGWFLIRESFIDDVCGVVRSDGDDYIYKLSFEEVLELVSTEMRVHLLFYLDIFTGKNYV